MRALDGIVQAPVASCVGADTAQVHSPRRPAPRRALRSVERPPSCHRSGATSAHPGGQHRRLGRSPDRLDRHVRRPGRSAPPARSLARSPRAGRRARLDGGVRAAGRSGTWASAPALGQDAGAVGDLALAAGERAGGTPAASQRSTRSRGAGMSLEISSSTSAYSASLPRLRRRAPGPGAGECRRDRSPAARSRSARRASARAR